VSGSIAEQGVLWMGMEHRPESMQLGRGIRNALSDEHCFCRAYASSIATLTSCIVLTNACGVITAIVWCVQNIVRCGSIQYVKQCGVVK